MPIERSVGEPVTLLSLASNNVTLLAAAEHGVTLWRGLGYARGWLVDSTAWSIAASS